MGSHNSKGKKYQEAGKYGQILLQTDSTTYFGGDTVTGRICLNMFMPSPGKQLNLKLKGKEAVYLVEETYEHHNRKTKKTAKLYEEKNNIIKMIVPVQSWPSLLPGQFVIPFAFMLPANLPSSFYQEGHNYLGYVAYRVEAILEPSTQNGPRLKYRQDIVIRQPLANPNQGISNEIKTDLTTLCCCKNGSNTLKVQLERNWYTPGDRTQVAVLLDNSQSNLDNTRTVFRLKHRLRMNAQGQSYEKTSNKIESSSTAGVRAGSKGTDNIIVLNLPPFQGGDYRSTKSRNMKNYLLSLNTLENFLHSATKSRLITSEYWLEVCSEMDGCLANSPSVVCPIEIYHPEALATPVYAPSDWRPQEMQLVNLTFGPQASAVPSQASYVKPANPPNIMMQSQQMMPPTLMVQHQPQVQYNQMPPQNMQFYPQMQTQPMQMYPQGQNPQFVSQFQGQPVFIQGQPVHQNSQYSYY